MNNPQTSHGHQSDQTHIPSVDQAFDQEKVKDADVMDQQDFQPDTGMHEDHEEQQVRRRNSIGTERVKLAEGEATEEA